MGPAEVQCKPIHWACRPLQTTVSPSDAVIRVSNHNLAIPVGLDVLPNFVSLEGCLQVVDVFDNGDSAWEGFEQRRRVLRWSSENDTSLPECLQTLTNKFQQFTGHFPLHVSVEEYPKSQLHKRFNTHQTTVTTFESPTLCSCENSCSCVVGVLPIAGSIIESINRPKRRTADCWDLCSSQHHSSGILLSRRTLYLKTKEFLWEWRSRIHTPVDNDLEEEDDEDVVDSIGKTLAHRYILVKFTKVATGQTHKEKDNLPNSHKSSKDHDFEFGHIPRPEDLIPPTEEMPPLEDLLTVIVTTSPIRSNPSTELLERVFQTFFHGGYDFAVKCRKVIVCDGCRERSDKTSKRHATSKQAMRNGIVDPEQLKNYDAFKKALRELCSSAPETSPFYHAEVEELTERLGYGFALRHALQHCIQTRFVIVIQHDRTFMRLCPIYETVRTMWYRRHIKYVGMSMRSNLMYRDIFLGKYGRSYMDEMTEATLRPPELALDAKLYGPNSRSFHTMDYAGQDKLRENILALVETYRGSHHHADYSDWQQSHPQPPGTWQCSLTPTFFWYDNVHICETAHYRDFIFHPSYKMVVRGGFVEDKLSPVIKKTVERLGLREGHARFGCFLLDDHSGMFFTGHLDGGNYLTAQQREALTKRQKEP